MTGSEYEPRAEQFLVETRPGGTDDGGVGKHTSFPLRHVLMTRPHVSSMCHDAQLCPSRLYLESRCRTLHAAGKSSVMVKRL